MCSIGRTTGEMTRPECGESCHEPMDEYGYGCDQMPCVNEGCEVCPTIVIFRGVEVPVTDPEPLPRVSGKPVDTYWGYFYDPGTFQAVFADLFQETFDLLVERQRKYGPENISSQGIYGVFTRMSADKIERLRRSMNGRVIEGRIELDEFVDASDETVEDALLDIANYALIMLALKRGVWGKPLQEQP